ncbi:DUF2971 domain-containing protein [Aliarcobacter faecis]|uniref:DUF2971 domain-containing protein n=1 Tax=Aliarcobacter faecis TaxID=1564138 RepID=UPI00047B034F|nr:DUF2971 domain-containing protein [Aliarcobacter faecis]QKF72747.1 DUF2971 domain-containing protein [Aliarcobacter faecis]
MDNPPEFLYKYRNFEDKFMKDIIINSYLYFSQAKKFNDPFDLKLDFKKSYRKQERVYFIKKLCKEKRLSFGKSRNLKDIAKNNNNFLNHLNKAVKTTLDKVGILSLSANPKSILMWSHYANNHTGLAFEFKYKESNSYLKLASQVKYQDNYEPLSYINIDNLKPKEINEMLIAKYTDWQYEEEYRIIMNKYHGTKPFDKSDLTSIIFGLEATNKNIKEIKTLCTENGFGHVKFRKMERVYGKFELKIVDLK